MMMKNIAAALLTAAALIATPYAAGEDKLAGTTDMQALRDAVKADKRALVASTIQLTDAEAKKFWPPYETYQRALELASRQRAVVIEELLGLGKPLSDRYAQIVANKLIAADEAEIKARRKMQSVVIKLLPGTKALRYLQLEAKIRAYQAYDLASAFPPLM
jgi:hypothetical protein